MLCYRSFDKVDGTKGKDLVRVVNVHPTFVGIGKRGQINNFDFTKLRIDLEPSCDSHEIV